LTKKTFTEVKIDSVVIANQEFIIRKCDATYSLVTVKITFCNLDKKNTL